MINQLAIIIVSFIAIYFSSKEALKRIVRLAKHYRVGEIVISFIIIGIMSILPELSIGISAATENVPNFGLGVIIGSNVADMTIIIGIIAVIWGRIKIHKKVTDQIKYFVFGITLPTLLLLDGSISQVEGGILLASFLFYITYVYFSNKKDNVVNKKQDINVVFELTILIISVAFLLICGNLITDAAKEISQILAIPIIFLGVVFAIGTCLPELSVAMRASRDKHEDVGLGGIMGNVITDSTLSIGIVALIRPITPEYPILAISTGLFAIASFLILWYFVSRKNEVTRRNGAFLIVFYVIFLLVQTVLEDLVVNSPRVV